MTSSQIENLQFINEHLLNELKVDIAASLKLLDHNIISSLCIVPKQVHDESSKQHRPTSIETNETTIYTILLNIRDQLVGHPLRKRLYISADLIPRLQAILFARSENADINAHEPELNICVLKVLHSLLASRNIVMGYQFISDYVAFLIHTDIKDTQWNWTLRVLVLLLNGSCLSITEMLPLIRKFATILSNFATSSQTEHDLEESSIMITLLADFCLAKPSLIPVLEQEGVVAWLFSHINDGCFYSIDEFKLKLLDSLADSYAGTISKYFTEILCASSKRKKERLLLTSIFTKIIISHPSPEFRIELGDLVINRSIPIICFFLQGTNYQIEDLPCRCAMENPCDGITSTLVFEKSQVKLSLLLLKKILALFQGDKYRSLSSFQSTASSTLHNIDPLTKLLLQKIDAFPEETMDCFLSLLEELSKNEFPQFLLFESDDQRLEFMEILISNIKSNDEPILLMALKTLRALSRNVQEIRSIHFDEFHSIQLAQALVERLDYTFRDFSLQFTSILLNVIANLSLEFSGLRLAGLVPKISLLLEKELSQGPSADGETNKLIEKILQVFMNISHRAPFQLRELIVFSLGEHSKRALLSPKYAAARGILQNFACADSFDQVLVEPDLLISSQIDWFLKIFGKDLIFELLSREEYLPLLSNLTFAASHHLREEISNTESILKVILAIFHKRLDSPSNADALSINSALLAAVHMKKGLGFDKILSAIRSISESDSSPEIRQLALEALEQLSPSTFSALSQNHDIHGHERIPLPPPI